MVASSYGIPNSMTTVRTKAQAARQILLEEDPKRINLKESHLDNQLDPLIIRPLQMLR